MQLWNRFDGVIDPKADVGVHNRDRQVEMSFALKIIAMSHHENTEKNTPGNRDSCLLYKKAWK